MDDRVLQQILELARRVLWKLLYYTYDRVPEIGSEIQEQDLHESFVGGARSVAIRYAHVRMTDLANAWEPDSAFFPTLAQLMANIAIPGKVYEKGSRKIALEIGECLLRFEGFAPKSPRALEAFRDDFLSYQVFRQTAIKPLTGKYAKLLSKYWEYSGTPELQAFKEVDDFCIRNGNDLYVFAR
jgi:hypothetical protein